MRDVQQLGLGLRGAGEGLRRIPRLTMERRLVMEAVEIAASDGRAFSEVSLRWWSSNPGLRYRASTRVLKWLIREGLVEVMGLGPAVYRVTRLGRIAMRMR